MPVPIFVGVGVALLAGGGTVKLAAALGVASLKVKAAVGAGVGVTAGVTGGVVTNRLMNRGPVDPNPIPNIPPGVTIANHKSSLIDIDELRACRNRLGENTISTDGQFNELSQTLSGVSTVIGSGSALGQGIQELSQQCQGLATQLRGNLNQIEAFCDARIAEAEAGTSSSSSELQTLAADLNNINL